MGIVEQYLLQLKSEKRRWRRTAAILTVLSLLVASGVSWNLRMTGITIANGATCGLEEHQHTAECPMEKVLICGFDDEPVPETPTEIPPEAPAETPTEAPPEVIAETPTEAPVEAIAEVPTEAPTESPAEAQAETSVEAVAEEQEENALAVIVNAAADVLSGIVPAAYAAELPTEYQTDGAAPGHIHTEECYEITWLCGIPEHIHEISCYADTTADIESPVIWEATLPEFTKEWADDLAQIAQSQLGCGESEINYIVEDDTQIRNGITRYGQWYGNPYGDWSSTFVMFCLFYAEIPQEAVPWSPGVYNMMRLAQDAQIFLPPDEHIGCSGNLLFLDTDENDNADRIAVVCALENETITAVCGDWENTVASITLTDSDPHIMGYINIGQLQEVWEVQKEPDSDMPAETVFTEPTEAVLETIPEETVPEGTVPEGTVPEETVPEGTVSGETTPESDETAGKPAIRLDVEFPEEGILRLVAHISNMEEAMYTWQWQVSEDGNEPWADIDGATALVWDLESTEENFNRYYRLRGQKAAMMYALRAAVEEEDSPDLPEDNDTTPIWKNNTVAMSFGGWYLDEALTQQVTADYAFFEDTILYAKWSPKDEGYYVYFMDFAREGQVPLVLVTYSVTEGQKVSPYTPGNAPAGTEWDGKWYLDSNCDNPYNFLIPVSEMTNYLTGANGRDLYLYPGTIAVCRAIFVTYGTRVDPISVPVGGTVDLDLYRPERAGFQFEGWKLQDGTEVSGVQTLTETTTFYAVWNADYVPFEAILRIENANDTGMTQADILGTWYAKAGSQIRVKSTYSGTGDSRKGTHEVVCVVDGVEYPVSVLYLRSIYRQYSEEKR